jgi:hypothetical protein
MAYKKIIILFVVLILTNSRCGDPYNDINTHDGEYVNNDPKYPPTELDTWLYNSFTAPYNIEVKYRWDNSEVDPYKNLVPPSVGKVQDVMDVVKRVWIDTYSDIAGADFIKQYCPKQFILVGSGSYNFDGSTTLGTAEGGRKILLYVINHFDADDQEGVKDLFPTLRSSNKLQVAVTRRTGVLCQRARPAPVDLSPVMLWLLRMKILLR